MFLRRVERRKNGKTHVYWNIVENKRLDDGRVAQRHVYYLGEINSSQAEAWRKAIEVFDVDAGRSRTLALFPEDRCEAAAERRLGGAAAPVRDAPAPAAAVGRLLAGRAVVAGAATRPILGRATAAEPQADALGPRSAGAGRLSADRARKRVAAASGMVLQ